YQAWRDVWFKHGTVVGDDRNAAVPLPERKRLALAYADLELAGIELEDVRIGDPGIGLEPCARPLDIEEDERAAAGDSGDGEHLLAADMDIASELHRGDAESSRVANLIARILEGGDDRGQVVAHDYAVRDAGEDEKRGRGQAHAARQLDSQDREPQAAPLPSEVGTRRPPRLGSDRRDGPLRPRRRRRRRARLRDPSQRLSEASSTIHRTSSSNVMPACAASSGTSDVSVMPGCLLASRQTSPPVPSIRSS